LLGEVHDLDVLWATAQNVDQAVDRNVSAFPDLESRKRWREKLTHERNRRLARYREKMVGRQSLWQVWRAELPAGPQLRAAAMSRLRMWAGYLDPDFSHAQRVAQLGLQLYDGLRTAGLLATHAAATNLEQTRDADAESDWQYDSRAVLQAAAQMHDVGKARGAENHQKISYRMIRGLARPLGWSARELELAAVVARYHRGALPHPRGKTMQSLPLTDRPIAMELAAILRLANALDLHLAHHQSREENEASPKLEVSSRDHFVLVRAAGYAALDRSAESVAAARHLLETVLRRPVLVRTLRAAPAVGASRPRNIQATSNSGGVGGDSAHARARVRETRP